MASYILKLVKSKKFILYIWIIFFIGLFCLLFSITTIDNRNNSLGLNNKALSFPLKTYKLETSKKTTDLIPVETYINPPNKLELYSSYGDNQAYHPKTIYFENGWNGYKYWMSFTPYPYANSKYENPHVKVSNDMINWYYIEGSPWPLDEPGDWANGKVYNSDSHLVYNDKTDTLECWWRRVNHFDKTMTIFRRTTKDGINWTDKEIIFKQKRSKVDWLSPAVIFEDNTYKIWYVFDNKIYYVESKNLKVFSKPRLLDIKFEDKTLAWHLDVIHTDRGYEMVIVSYRNWAKRKIMNLYYTSSKDNKKYSIAKVVLSPTRGTNSWDNSGLYRSSILYIDGYYYIYYSGQSTKSAKGIGLVYGEDIFNLKAYNY